MLCDRCGDTIAWSELHETNDGVDARGSGVYCLLNGRDTTGYVRYRDGIEVAAWCVLCRELEDGEIQKIPRVGALRFCFECRAWVAASSKKLAWCPVCEPFLLDTIKSITSTAKMNAAKAARTSGRREGRATLLAAASRLADALERDAGSGKDAEEATYGARALREFVHLHRETKPTTKGAKTHARKH